MGLFRNNTDKKAYEKALAQLRNNEKPDKLIKNSKIHSDDNISDNQFEDLLSIYDNKSQSDKQALNKSNIKNKSNDATIERVSLEKDSNIKFESQENHSETFGLKYNEGVSRKFGAGRTKKAMTEVVDTRSYVKPVQNIAVVNNSESNKIDTKYREFNKSSQVEQTSESKDAPKQMTYFEKFIKELEESKIKKAEKNDTLINSSVSTSENKNELNSQIDDLFSVEDDEVPENLIKDLEVDIPENYMDKRMQNLKKNNTLDEITFVQNEDSIGTGSSLLLSHDNNKNSKKSLSVQGVKSRTRKTKKKIDIDIVSDDLL